MKPDDALLQEQVNYLADQARTALAADLVILLAKSNDEHGDKVFGVTGLSAQGVDIDVDQVLVGGVLLLCQSLQQLIKEATDGNVEVILRTPNGDVSLSNSKTLHFQAGADL